MIEGNEVTENEDDFIQWNFIKIKWNKFSLPMHCGGSTKKTNQIFKRKCLTNASLNLYNLININQCASVI